MGYGSVSTRKGSVVVVLAIIFVGAGQFFEKVGVLDRCGDLVVTTCPLSEVDAAAAVGAEGEIFAARQNNRSTCGAAQNLDGGFVFSFHLNLF